MKGGNNMRMNPNDLMRQVQKMQREVERVQEEAGQELVTVTAGGGAVTIVINGALEVKEFKLQREVVDPEDVEMLQDLLMAAMNEAIEKAQAMMAQRMSAVTGGLGLPGF